MGYQEIDLYSLGKTDIVAKKIATHLFPGSIVMLWGEMGSGKTTFTKSLCNGLGVSSEIVSSPTYTLVNVYPGKHPIFHVDLFRLISSQELSDFDRQDLITDEGITIIEWPKFILNFLSDEPILNMNFETISEKKKQLKLESHSPEFDILFDTLKQLN